MADHQDPVLSQQPPPPIKLSPNSLAALDAHRAKGYFKQGEDERRYASTLRLPTPTRALLELLDGRPRTARALMARALIGDDGKAIGFKGAAEGLKWVLSEGWRDPKTLPAFMAAIRLIHDLFDRPLDEKEASAASSTAQPRQTRLILTLEDGAAIGGAADGVASGASSAPLEGEAVAWDGRRPGAAADVVAESPAASEADEEPGA